MLLSNSMMSKVTLVAYNELWECLPHRNTNTTDQGFDSRRGTSLAETPARLQGLAKTKSQLQRSKRNTSALMWSHTHGETLETCPSVLKKKPSQYGLSSLQRHWRADDLQNEQEARCLGRGAGG